LITLPLDKTYNPCQDNIMHEISRTFFQNVYHKNIDAFIRSDHADNQKDVSYVKFGKLVRMKRLFFTLQEIVDSKNNNCPIKIAIDGIDALGKTVFADHFAEYLGKNSTRQIIRASIDGFHNPREIRLQKGDYSPEGYYDDSFNYSALKKFLLDPMMPSGNRQFRTHIFDYKSDREILEAQFLAEDDAILIFDGIFLMRRELVNYWDFKIFLKISFQTALSRALKRDKEYLGDENVLREKYEKRYFPGQELYLSNSHPEQIADVVIDNEDFNNAKIIKKFLLNSLN